MKWFGSLAEWFDDSASPIVVKELRQAVRGKFIYVILVLFLIIQLFTIGSFTLWQDLTGVSPAGEGEAVGRESFAIQLAFLIGTCLLCVPAYTAIRLVLEKSDSNVDLLFITTITPRSILLGKFLAGLTMTLIVYSSCLPFLVFTYFLRGIDLETIFWSLCMGLLAIATSMSIAIFIAGLPTSRPFKILLGLAGGIGLFLELISFMVLVREVLQGSLGYRYGAIFNSWNVLGISVLAAMLANYLFLTLAIAQFTPPAANRALPVRIAVSCVWLATGVAAVWHRFVGGTSGAVGVWAGCSMAVFATFLLVSSGERETLGPRLIRDVPRRVWLRPLAFLFFSGAAGGMIWAVVWMAMTQAVLLIVIKSLGDAAATPGVTLRITFWNSADFALYLVAYSLSAVFLRRKLLHRWVRPEHTWVVGAAFLLVGSLLPPLLAYLFLLRREAVFSKYYSWWSVFNPFPSVYDEYVAARTIFAGSWALMALLLTFPWIWRQIRAFRPSEPSLAQGEPGPA